MSLWEGVVIDQIEKRRPADRSLVYIIVSVIIIFIRSSVEYGPFVEIHSPPGDRYAPLTRRDPHLPSNTTTGAREGSRVERRPGGGRRDGEKRGGDHRGGLGHRGGVEQ